MASIDLSISLLSFNNKELLKNCLLSIYRSTKNINYETLLVDNASRDDSVAMVKKKFPQVKLIANKTNRLYIKGHNQNLRRVKGRYFLILNEDTQIPAGTLDKMVAFMDKNPKIGLASCRQVGQDGKVDMTCSRFPHPLFEIFESSYFGKFSQKILKNKKINQILKSYRYADWNRDSIKKVDVIPGSFFIAKSELLKKVGLFDESNFLFFYGEPDYCLRVKRAGYQIYHNGRVTITHLKSKALSKLPNKKRLKISLHDMLAYYKKHFGLGWNIILWVLTRPNWFYLQK